MVNNANAIHSALIGSQFGNQNRVTADFNEDLDQSAKEIESAVQTIRRRQSDISTHLAKDWHYLNFVVIFACILAITAVALLIFYQSNLARLKDTERTLLSTRGELESRVRERTSKLSSSYRTLLTQVAERKRTEVALRDSETRYRSLVELSPDGIAVYCEGILVYINASGAKLFGAANPTDLVGMNLMRFIHPDHLNAVNSRLFLALEANETSGSTEERITKLDGTTANVEIGAIPCSFEDKRAVQLIFHDVTSRKKLEEQLRQSQKMEAVG